MTQVSVIMPAYNAARFVEEAIVSVLTQSLTDLELIIVDDCSTDATATIAEQFARSDPRVRILRQTTNAGPSAARNCGLDVAIGAWIGILDADDAYLPDRLATLVSLGEAQQLDMVADNLLLIPEDRPEAAQPMIPSAMLATPRPMTFEEFVIRNVADPRHPGCNFGFLKPLFRAEFMQRNELRYDERVRFAEDFTLYVEALSRHARWWLTPFAGYRYRIRGDSLTQVQTVHDLQRLREVQARLLVQNVDAPPLIAAIRRHQLVVDRSYLYRSFTDDLKSHAFTAALRTFCSSPRSAILIIQESLRQLPIIAAKVARGGYS